jgi:hypothetical protein
MPQCGSATNSEAQVTLLGIRGLTSREQLSTNEVQSDRQWPDGRRPDRRGHRERYLSLPLRRAPLIVLHTFTDPKDGAYSTSTEPPTRAATPISASCSGWPSRPWIRFGIACSLFMPPGVAGSNSGCKLAKNNVRETTLDGKSD